MKYKIKDLKQKHVHKASKNSSIAGIINNEIFLNVIEKEIISFTGIKIIDNFIFKNLSYKESREIREKIKDILINEGIWTEVKQKKQDKFSNNEIKQFQKMQNTVYEKVKSGAYFDKNGRTRNKR
ncbi:MAG: hypothetical protein ACOCUD_03700 [Bacillota bacterium]